jgi:hypothetical protein
MDFGPYLDYAIAAAIVLALLVIAMLVLKAVGGRVRARQGSRLGVSEYHEVDKQRRLVLVRRDGVEHLLMIGGEQDLVIETGIGRELAAAAAAPRASEHAETPALGELRPVPAFGRAEAEDTRAVPLRAAPRPPVFGDRPPEAPKRRAEPRLESVKKSEDDAV